MSGISALHNNERFSELLMSNSTRRVGTESLAGERVVIAAIDGEAAIVDGRVTASGALPKGIRRRRMTLFPTDRHVVVYQAKGGIARDIGLAVPVRHISQIAYEVVPDDRGRAVCEIRFVTKDGSGSPTIVFFVDVVDVFSYDATIGVIQAIGKLSGARLIDGSDANEMSALGLKPLTRMRYNGHESTRGTRR